MDVRGIHTREDGFPLREYSRRDAANDALAGREHQVHVHHAPQRFDDLHGGGQSMALGGMLVKLETLGANTRDDAAAIDSLTRAAVAGHDDARVIPELLAAGRQAYSMLDYTRAEPLYQRALAALPAAVESGCDVFLTNDNQLQGAQFDYRQVFTTLLQDWLGANEEVLTETMFEGYTKMALVDAAAIVNPDCYLPMTVGTQDNYLKEKPLTIFPNPANIQAEIGFSNTSAAFEARLTLHSLGGSLVSVANVRVEQDTNVYFLDVSSLPPAPYFVRLENKLTGRAFVAKLNVIR